MKRRTRTPDLEKVAEKYIVDMAGHDFSSKMAATAVSRNFLDFMEEYEQQEPRSFGVVGYLLESMDQFGELNVLTDGSVLREGRYDFEIVYPGMVLDRIKTDSSRYRQLLKPHWPHFYVYFLNGYLYRFAESIEKVKEFGSGAEIKFGIAVTKMATNSTLHLYGIGLSEFYQTIGIPTPSSKFLPPDWADANKFMKATYIAGLIKIGIERNNDYDKTLGLAFRNG